ncbi:MAG: hypothetical protein MJE77_01960 [Proteobacteria bacterium]|nr:hypothetical protein [Pseudomonadota bacterium]
MIPDRREIATIVLGLFITLVIGILVGRYGCAPQPDKQVERIVQKAIEPAPRQVVYRCPAADEKTPVPAAQPGRAKRGKQPPDSAISKSPLPRRRLLAWVRDQSRDLASCSAGSKATYRMMVRLVLNKAGRVDKVHVNTAPEDVPRHVRNCLQTRMATWQPPGHLVGKADSELLFGLTL